MTEVNDASIKRRGNLTGGRPGPPRFCKHVTYNNTLYIAGQVPFDTSDATYKGKLAEIVQVLKLLDDILLEAGTCKQNIVKVCSYLKSIDEGADGYNEAWDAWVDTQNLPVRTTIEAKLMRPDFLVEIDLIVAVL